MPTVPFAILLPPSEGKAEGGDGPGWSTDDGAFGATIAPQRAQVVAALARAGGGDQTLLGVGGAHLTRAQSANVQLLGAPTLPAWRRYTGVVWDHLDVAGLPPGARARASASVVVLSGLLGLAALDDPVPDYRLKMGARLGTLGGLARWWREPLSATLNAWLAGRVVVDLLPHEHAAAWVPDPARYRAWHRVGFVERDGKVAGHDAKAAKGLLARHLLTSRAAPARALASFSHPRFSLTVTTARVRLPLPAPGRR